MRAMDNRATKKAQFKLAYFETGSINNASKICNVSRGIAQKWAKEFKKDSKKIDKQKIDYEDILVHECFGWMIENIKLGITLHNKFLKSINPEDPISIEKNIDKITRIVGVTSDKVLKLIEIRHQKLILIDSGDNKTIIDLRRDDDTKKVQNIS